VNRPRTTWVGAPGEQPSSDLVGGKGRSLDTLHRLGLRVPEAFVVTTEAYRSAVTGPLATEIDRRVAALRPDADLQTLHSESSAIRELLIAGTNGHTAETEILDAYQRLAERLGEEAPSVAVRSSSAAEDSADRSFAGEHDSYLWVLGAEEVGEAVRRCWASLFTARAISYRARDGARPTGDAMAVVVQRMVDARCAGVFMTLNPVNGDRSKVVVESVWGLGEPLVSGTATPDRFVLDKVTREVLVREVAEKPTRVTRDPVSGRGVVTVQVDEQDRRRPSLGDAQLLRLLEMARAVERHAGCPQDGEFAVDSEHVHLVQARPETVWTCKPTPRVTRDASGALAHVVTALTSRTKASD